jgi:hypothetical protein
MNIDFSKDDLMLIDMVLSQEESETIVEIHHCKNMGYKEYLKQRNKETADLLARIKSALEKMP